jgi:hypothetical protein
VPSRLVGGVGLLVSDTVKSLLITVFRNGGCCGPERSQRCFRLSLGASRLAWS